MSCTPTAPAAPATAAPTVVRRRSSRLAAKPAVTYTEPTDTPDELLMERTKAMYEVLLEERLAPATRDLYGVYRRSKQDFLKLYEDLPEDNVERIAAETYVNSLNKWSHSIVPKYAMELTNKAFKEKRDLATAKVRINEDLYKKAIETYNEILVLKAKLAECESTLANYSVEIRAVLQSERSEAARTGVKDALKKYSEKKFRTLRADSQSSAHAIGFLKAVKTGKFPKSVPGYKY
jgi:hypothetical protein